MENVDAFVLADSQPSWVQATSSDQSSLSCNFSARAVQMYPVCVRTNGLSGTWHLVLFPSSVLKVWHVL